MGCCEAREKQLNLAKKPNPLNSKKHFTGYFKTPENQLTIFDFIQITFDEGSIYGEGIIKSKEFKITGEYSEADRVEIQFHYIETGTESKFSGKMKSTASQL